MGRMLVLVSTMILAGAVALAQHGRGMGRAGGPPTTVPQGPKAGHAPHGTPAQPGVKTMPSHTVATQLEKHPQLVTRLQPLVPEGMIVTDAAEGFKNQGQFIAALHVSQNLGIPFADLKARMTGDKPMSLGAAIHELKPDLPEDHARNAEREAERQAKEDQRAARGNKP